MTTVTLPDGYEVQLNEAALDNMELLEAMVDADKGDSIATVRMVQLLLSDDQRRALYDHLRTEDGRVPATAVYNAVADIFNSMGSAGKNS